MKCEKCNKELPEIDVVFCPFCGKKQIKNTQHQFIANFQYIPLMDDEEFRQFFDELIAMPVENAKKYLLSSQPRFVWFIYCERSWFENCGGRRKRLYSNSRVSVKELKKISNENYEHLDVQPKLYALGKGNANKTLGMDFFKTREECEKAISEVMNNA